MTRATLALAALLAGPALAASPQPPAVQLAEGGRALLPVVVATNASPRIRVAASNLVHYLSRIAGEPFALEPGAGPDGILVGLPAHFPAFPNPPAFTPSPFAREDYLIRSAARSLALLGATDLAVEHAVWDLLDRLGYRQFFPGPVWEVVPASPDLAIAVDVREAPAFHARRIWYNWGLWGYNNKPYAEWCARNRMAKGFNLNSGHSYQAIVAAHKAEFEAHPEFFALVNGERKRGGDAKFCVGNPALRDLIARYAARPFTAKPETDSISLDPSDGGGWCECADCAAIGTPSDRALTLANIAAESANALGLGPKYIGMYAYNQHGPPPALRVHSNVIISATTAFLTGGFSLDQIIDGWQAQGATLGIYDYYSVIAWDWNLPGRSRVSDPRAAANNVRRFHQKGARFYDCEAGDAWGPYGLGFYIAARAMWNPDEADRVDHWTADFLDRAFGPAREPMQNFYHLITADKTRRSARDQTGRLYRFLLIARDLAGGRPDVLARLDQLTLYTRYVELYHAYANATGDARDKAKDRVVAYAYRIRKTMMIHAYGFWARTVGQKAAHDPQHPLKDETPVEEADILEILRNGIAANPIEEIAFEAVTFSDELVPAAPLRLPDAPAGSFPTVPQDRQSYWLWVSNAPADITLQVTVQKVWALRPHHIRLYSPLDVTIEPVAESGDARPDGQTRAITLRTPHPGLHRLETNDGGDYTRLGFPAGMPVTLPSAMDTPGAGNHFRGPWTLYVYVPKGTTVVAGWAARIAAWAPRISGTLKDGDGNVALDFAKLEDGWFQAPVPAGQDGRLWKFENTHGLRQLMTVPPFLARSPAELLLPREVVERDAPKPPGPTP